MLRYLIPHISLRDLSAMLGVAGIGGFLAGLYGIVHDQLTYSLSPEYFTKQKFAQFFYADLGLGDRVFAGTIGFLAASAAGLIATWLLARRLIPGQPHGVAYRQIARGFAIVLAGAFVGGIAGYLYGLWQGPDSDFSWWKWATLTYQIEDVRSFIHVAYIHNGGYLGGLLGLIAVLWFIRPRTTCETGCRLG